MLPKSLLGYVVAFTAWLYFPLLCNSFSMGKGEIVFKHTRVCPDLKDGWNTTIKTTKLSRSRTLMTMFLDARAPFDNNIKVLLGLSIWTNGGWKANVYNMKTNDVCNAFRTNIRKVFMKVADDSKINATCPIPAVPIKLINFAIDMNDYNVPKTMLPHGKLKVDVNFYLRKKRVVCISTVVEVVPS